MAADKRKRTVLWYAKWFFASYALAIALFLLGLVVSLVTVGPLKYIDFFFTGTFRGWAMLALTLIVSPLVYRRLQ